MHKKRATFTTRTIARNRVQAWPICRAPTLPQHNIRFDRSGRRQCIGGTFEQSVRGRAEKREDTEINIELPIERVVLMEYRDRAIRAPTMRALFHDAQSSIR